MTTISMTAVSVSTRSDQLMSSVPESIQEKSGTTSIFSGPKPMRTKTKIDKRRGDQQRGAGHDLGRPVADHAAEQACDRGGEQRQEDDELDGKIHGDSPCPSPSSR